MWEAIMHGAIDDAVEAVTDVMREIGLLYPDQTPTQKFICAMIGAGRDPPLDGDGLYDVVDKLRTCLHHKRKRPTTGAPDKLPVYPECIDAFIEMHPSCYENEPPVEPWVDRRSIDRVARIQPILCKKQKRSPRNYQCKHWVRQPTLISIIVTTNVPAAAHEWNEPNDDDDGCRQLLDATDGVHARWSLA